MFRADGPHSLSINSALPLNHIFRVLNLCLHPQYSPHNCNHEPRVVRTPTVPNGFEKLTKPSYTAFSRYSRP